MHLSCCTTRYGGQLASLAGSQRNSAHLTGGWSVTDCAPPNRTRVILSKTSALRTAALTKQVRGRVCIGPVTHRQRPIGHDRHKSLSVQVGVLQAGGVALENSTSAERYAYPTTPIDDVARAARAQELGYRTIGKELPDDVTLQAIIKSLPPEVFELNPWRAWGGVATTLLAVSASLYLISVSPVWLLPFAWALAGTAFTGLFVIGHDCGHRSFSKDKLVEDIVGTVMFAPLVYPFEPWRIKHNHHHAHTNKLVEDTAWHPVMPSDLDKWGDSFAGAVCKVFLGTPLKLWASVGHWALWHFDVNKFTENQRSRVFVSWAAVAAFVCVGMPLIVNYTGLAGLIKYWLMPWLGYHFWMSTFTVVHHTAPHIPFKPAGEWNAAKAQLSGTVHCDFPFWVEFLCHDISVHVPHHVSAKIPWYNLRAANESLRQKWGQYMTECDFNWRLVKNICTELHVYDEVNNYKPFDAYPGHESPLFMLQRAVVPDVM